MPDQVHNEAPTWCLSGLTEALEVADGPAEPGAKAKSRAESPHRTDWTGTASWGEAYDLIRSGIPPETADLKEEATKLLGSLKSRMGGTQVHQEVRRTGQPVPALALTGSPMASQSPTVKGDTQPLRILANTGMIATASHEEARLRGAVTLTLAKAAKSLGLPVEVWVGWGVRYGVSPTEDNTAEVLFPLVKPGQPLDPATMAALALHPSGHRRFGFALRERFPDPQGRATGGYGGSIDFSPSTQEDFDIVVPTLNGCGHPFGSQEEALDWATQELQALIPD